MPSFDAVSELNSHEVANAVDQANRELAQRFDFKDTDATFELKDSKLKVQASIQGDKVRVTGKQRDELQAAMALLRGAKLEVALQFNNFRD